MADFLGAAARVLNAGQARTLVLAGNVHDLFRLEHDLGADYVPLVNLLAARWNVGSRSLLVYELNGPIRFAADADRDKLRDAWLKWRTGLDADTLALELMTASRKSRAELEMMNHAFDKNLQSALGNPTVALELLRQFCLASRAALQEDLIVVIEGADLLLPEGEITRLPDADRRRVAICQDWFGDPGFMNGEDAVVLIAESRSLLNHRVARLPQILEIAVPGPDETARLEFINWFETAGGRSLALWSTREDLARLAAGLSLHALRQLLTGAAHVDRPLSQADVVAKVEAYIQSQLGEEVVEFKKPEHRLADVVGFSRLKTFLGAELMPRFKATGKEALPGAAVCGPIGGGKTFIFEAVAAELDMVVIVLKNIRSQWFGQTDVIFERLRRVLEVLSKVVIFVDEADTQFGGVGETAHATERRLTGKIQAMMSDTRLRGRVIWLLMTARIQLLSPDIRRPGRVGDLIIPILDPADEDRLAFLRWCVDGVAEAPLGEAEIRRLDKAMVGSSAAWFASLRAELKAAKIRFGGRLTFDDILSVVADRLPAAIGEARRYQTLQALINCTRRSLLPDPEVTGETRATWLQEIRALEARGVR